MAGLLGDPGGSRPGHPPESPPTAHAVGGFLGETMKAISNSVFSHTLLKSFKSFTKKRTEDEFHQFANLIFQNKLKVFEHVRSKQASAHNQTDLLFAELYSCFLWKFRTMDHYFMEDGVADFCTGSVKNFTEDYYKPMPSPDAVRCPKMDQGWLCDHAVANSDGSLKSGYVIHFPARERRNSVIVLPNFVFKLKGTRSAKIYLHAIVNGFDVILSPTHTSGKAPEHDDGGQEWLNRLVYGLGLYTEAFPEAITLTAMRANFKTGSGRCIRVKQSPIMKEENQHAVSPHYRRGHFRVLISERFTHKRGETVFVKGTFIKGKSFDVMNDAAPLALSTNHPTPHADHC